MTILVGHFSRAESDGTWTGGPPNYIPSIADWQSFEQRCMQAVDGDKGGTWAPSAPIVIAGSGMTCTGPITVYGVGATLTSLGVGAWSVVDTSWPLLGATHTGRSRTIQSTTLRAAPSVNSLGPSGVYPIVPNLAYGSSQTVIVPNTPATVLMVPLRVHDNATLTTVTVNWIVSTSHNTVTPPSFRVLAISSDGTATPMSSTATGADTNGFFYPTSSGASGWYNNGQPQSFEIPIDTLSVISLANYDYALEITEESGVAGFPWSAPILTQMPNLVATTNVTPSGTSNVIDGVTATNQFVLLTAQSDPTQNGLFEAGSSSWFRSGSSNIVSGQLLRINQGYALNNTFWQISPSPNPLSRLWSASQPLEGNVIVAPVNGAVGLAALNTTTGGSPFPSSGITGASEPTWPTQAGLIVVDGTITWTMINTPFAAPVVSQIIDPLLLNTGCPCYFAFGNIWLPVTCTFDNIADCRWD